LSPWLANDRLVGESDAVAVPAAAPVPLSVTVCGLPVALSVIVTAADRAPDAAGLNVTVTVHIDETATPPLQLFVTLKSVALAPVAEMLEIVTAPEPVFVMVAVWAALVVFTVWLANVSAVGATVIVVVAAAPVPLRATLCGLPAALSVIVTAAERAPEAVGLKVTLTAQFDETLTLPLQLFVTLKSPAFVPVAAMLEIVTAAEPVLLIVTV
jgi:hypothetical protein